MMMNSVTDRNRQLIGRIALTIAVACGASGTILHVSGSLTAIAQIDRIDDAGAELSRYIADGHASIREGVMTRGSSKDALTRFDTGVARRMKRLGDLALLALHTSAHDWTQRLRETRDVHPVEAERRAYVAAANTAATMPVDDLAVSLRLLDLRAQKLIQTVESVRDSADEARTEALSAVDEMTVLGLGMAGLLIAYLIWYPVFISATLEKPERHAICPAFL